VREVFFRGLQRLAFSRGSANSRAAKYAAMARFLQRTPHMPRASISELLAASPLMRPNERDHSLGAARELHVFRDDDGLKGKVHKGLRSPQARSGGLGAKLSKLLSERTGSGRRACLTGGKTAFVSDVRVLSPPRFTRAMEPGPTAGSSPMASISSVTAQEQTARRGSSTTVSMTRLRPTRERAELASLRGRRKGVRVR
jgi:hypothetical protein